MIIRTGVKEETQERILLVYKRTVHTVSRIVLTLNSNKAI